MGGIVLRIAQSTWEMPLPRAMPPARKMRRAASRQIAKEAPQRGLIGGKRR